MWYSLALARRQIFRFSIDETLDYFKILYPKSVPVFSYSSNAGEPTEHKEFSCITETVNLPRFHGKITKQIQFDRGFSH